MGVKSILALLAVLGWGVAVWSLRRPIPAPTERIVTKVEYRDRIVDRVVEKTTRRPDGSVTQTRVTTAEKEKRTAAAENHVKPASLPQYSLGVSKSLFSKTYQLDLGIRLGETPLWLTTSLGMDRTLLLGFRTEF